MKYNSPYKQILFS